MTGETETQLTEGLDPQVTEDIGIAVTEDFDAPGDEAGLPASPKIQHAVPDRGRARELFERLAALPEGDEERLRIRVARGGPDASEAALARMERHDPESFGPALGLAVRGTELSPHFR